MQDKSSQKPQRSIDGFVSTRQRRSVGFADTRIHKSDTTVGVVRRHDHSQPLNPILTKKEAGTGTVTASSLPVKNTRLSRRLQGADPRQRKKRSWKLLTKRTALIVLAVFLLGGGWLGWKIYSNTSKVFGNNNPLSVLSAFKPVPLKGQDQGRVNILLAGNSTDDEGHGGASLTDSVMLVSINTRDNNAFMVSIPRDMWVDIPGLGYNKINTANTASDFSEDGYFSGGMGMLQKVVDENFGVKAHYYALVNYSAFKEAVNSVGGIDVTIQSEDQRGLYDPSFREFEGGPLKLSNGPNHLNGQTALNLARARGDPFNGVYGTYGFTQSDFDRTKHQRQMMLGLKEKALSMNVLSNPIKVGELMDSVGDNVKTDFKVNELASLYYLMKKIKSDDIESLSLNNAEGSNLLANYTTATGQSALVPAAGVSDYSQIQKFLSKAMTNNKVSKEAAKVVILNGSNTTGLAKKESDALTKKGANITNVGDAPAATAKLTIVDNSANKKPETRKMLSSTYGSHFSTDAALAQQYDADFVIIIGSDYAQKQAGSSQSDI